MGVVNVTPDSFSDGGAWFEPDAAIAHGRDAASPQGADLIDVGGESTRPGAERPSVRGELRRVLPGRRGARATTAPVVSVDTMRAEVAAAGARRRRLARQRRERRPGRPRDGCRWSPSAAVPYVAMHWRGHSTRHAGARGLRRRRRRRMPRARPSAATRARRGRASRPIASCSTPASASPRTPSTTGRCWRTLDTSLAARAPAARRRLAQGVPRPARAHRRRRAPARRSSATCATAATTCSRPGRGVVRSRPRRRLDASGTRRRRGGCSAGTRGRPA